MKLSELKEKSILILGFGREGQDTFVFLRKLFPNKIIGIADQKNLESQTKNLKNVKTYFGENYLEAARDYDVIIKSPGIPIHLPEIERAYKEKKITSQAELFFDNCPGIIVGITGTKGKSTTTVLISQVLKGGGIKAYLVGNIGKPVLGLLSSAIPKDVYVYELSSHQLHGLKKSPHIAVFLNLFQEHLDYYKNFKEYAEAKANIFSHQNKNDYLVFNSGDKIVSQIAKKSRAKKVAIKGDYYELDKNATRAVGHILKIPERIVENEIKKFKNLPHRLELVGKFKEITFYNDALATIPEATIAALDALGDKVETIILGGLDRNIDFKNLAKRILRSKLKNLILFPTTGAKIQKEIIKLGGRASLRFESIPQKGKDKGEEYMQEAVRLAYKYTNKGKICLLSTASASFNLFKDYKEKGSLFKKYVKSFGA